MSFAQIKAADAKCGNSTGGVFKDRRELVATVEELAGTIRMLLDDITTPYDESWHEGSSVYAGRAALAKLEQP